MKAIFSAAAMIAVSMSGVASAQHLTPPDTTATLVGPATLSKAGLPNQNCTLTLTVRSGAALPGPAGHTDHTDTATIVSGTNSGGGLCSLITVDGGSAVWSGSSWSLSGLTVSVAGVSTCSGGTSLPVSITTTGGVTTVAMSGSIGSGCSASANLTGTGIQAVS